MAFTKKLGMDVEQEFHEMIKNGSILTGDSMTKWIKDAIEHYYKLTVRRSMGKEE